MLSSTAVRASSIIVRSNWLVLCSGSLLILYSGAHRSLSTSTLKPAGEADAGSWKIVGRTALTERKHLDRVNDWYSQGWAEVMPHLRKKWCQFWR